MTMIEDLVAGHSRAGRIAAAAIRLGITIDQLPLNLVEWGDGRTWHELAQTAGVDFPQEAGRREVRFLLTLEASK